MTNFENVTGRVILGTQYPYEVLPLIEKAERRVSVVQFYISYDPQKEDSKVNALVKALIAAKQRHIEVSVIMDKDKEGDVYNSRLINAPTYQVLKENRVPVFFDTVETATHSKIVVVDDQVVIGSHNWTLGSFYKYDDVSVEITSPEVAQYYADHIAARIVDFKKAVKRRRKIKQVIRAKLRAT